MKIMVLFSDNIIHSNKKSFVFAVCSVCILLLSPFAIINSNSEQENNFGQQKKKKYFRCISFQLGTHQRNISIVNQVLNVHHSFMAVHNAHAATDSLMQITCATIKRCNHCLRETHNEKERAKNKQKIFKSR